MEVKHIERIEVFGLKHNDIVIVRVRGTIDIETKERIEKTWGEIFEHQGYKNIKVLVLNESVELQIISNTSNG